MSDDYDTAFLAAVDQLEQSYRHGHAVRATRRECHRRGDCMSVRVPYRRIIQQICTKITVTAATAADVFESWPAQIEGNSALWLEKILTETCAVFVDNRHHNKVHLALLTPRYCSAQRSQLQP